MAAALIDNAPYFVVVIVPSAILAPVTARLAIFAVLIDPSWILAFCTSPAPIAAALIDDAAYFVVVIAPSAICSVSMDPAA